MKLWRCCAQCECVQVLPRVHGVGVAICHRSFQYWERGLRVVSVLAMGIWMSPFFGDPLVVGLGGVAVLEPRCNYIFRFHVY